MYGTRERGTIMVGPGARAQELKYEVGRELSAGEMELLAAPAQTGARPLKKLHDRHHQLAKMLAQGTSAAQASVFCGYNQAYVSTLKSDKAFQELIEFYRTVETAEYVDIAVQLKGLTRDTIVALREQVEGSLETEDEEKKLPVSVLLKIGEFAADRAGHGPSSSVTANINVNMSERLKLARERARAISHGQIIEAEVIPNAQS